MKDIRRVAIAGAGTMGYSLAQAFSAAGYPVKLYDLFPAALDKARDMIALNQQTEVTSGKLTAEQSAALIGRISLTSQLEDLANTDFLVEAILEKLEVKHDFYRQLCAVVAEDAILCSNTSGLSITKIAEAVTHPERFAGMHWMNPPHIIPLIEIVEGEKTAPETAECVRQVALGMKKKPVIVKDAPGHCQSRGGGRRDEVRAGFPVRLLWPLRDLRSGRAGHSPQHRQVHLRRPVQRHRAVWSHQRVH